MDLEELRAFLVVVDAGSFFAAAESLGISRTTLRRRVAALEARAGVTLLESTPQGIHVTDAGRLLARQGKAMLEEASALISSVRSLGTEPSGTFRLVLPGGMPPHVLVPLYATFRSLWPKLTLHASFSNDPLGEPRVDVDMVIHFGDGDPPGWVTRDLSRLRQWLIASADYLARCGTPQSIEDLDRHELLVWQAPGEDATVMTTTKGEKFKVRPVFVSTDIHLVRQCALSGHGIAYVPDALLPDPEGVAIPVLPDLVRDVCPLRFSVPRALEDAPRVKLVTNHIVAMVEAQVVTA